MRITKQKDGTLLVPDSPTIPFITGDGVGAEITPAMQEIVNSWLMVVVVTLNGRRCLPDNVRLTLPARGSPMIR